MKNLVTIAWILSSLICTHAIGEESRDLQDNILAGLKSFTILLPVDSPENKLFTQNLEHIGAVKPLSLTDPKGIDFSGFVGSFLWFKTHPISLTGQQNSDLLEVSLELRTSIELLRTQNKFINTSVWSTRAFCSKRQLPEAIKQIVQDFSTQFIQANPDQKPLFYVY